MGAPANSALTFKLSVDRRHLLAVFAPVEGQPTPDVEAVRALLDQEGFAAWGIDSKVLRDLVDQMDSTQASFERELAERVDGECHVTISKDHMTARLTLTAPRGGPAVTLGQVHRSLYEIGVVSGISDPAINAALAQGAVVDHVVAQGKPPVDGADAKFETLVMQAKVRRPKVDERGVADYRDLGQLIVVKQGEPLMRRTPPTPGTMGQDVMGQHVAPRPGRDIPFDPNLLGAAVSPADSNLLLAAVTGQPVLLPYGVMVEPSISFPQVDMSSGHVRFEGSVCVTGDVHEGMKIVATGDVFVAGAVEAAEIEAGGNIVIKGGVIGRSEYAGASSTGATEFSARLRSKGSINVLYAEHASLEAGSDIYIDEFAMHSDLLAMNQIIVGKPGTKKGHLLGGSARATALIKVTALGSNANLLTKVQAGFNPYVQNQVRAVELEIEANEKERLGLQKIVDYVLEHPEKDKDGLLKKAQNTLARLREGLVLLQETLRELQVTRKLASQAHVIVTQVVHGGAQVQLGDRKWQTMERLGPGVFRLVEDEIDYGNVIP